MTGICVLNAAKLVTVVAGIKKLQIMMTIEDDLVSIDNLIEDYLTSEPNNEYIQSCDIVAFNKICKWLELHSWVLCAGSWVLASIFLHELLPGMSLTLILMVVVWIAETNKAETSVLAGLVSSTSEN
jgi:hypothetical protein